MTRHVAGVLALVCSLAACTDTPAPPMPTEAARIAPTDARLRVTGRTVEEAGALAFDWSAVQVEAVFTGARVALALADSLGEYAVYVDDRPMQRLVPGLDTLHVLADELGDGPHTLRIVRRTEADFGAARFGGLVLAPGADLAPLPPAPARRIAFLGDSITTGYGNEGDSPSCPFTPGTENVELSYAGQLAAQFGAAYEVVAYHGRGVVRNYGSARAASSHTMPVLYRYAAASLVPSDAEKARAGGAYDFQSWVPHAVVVNLGTNDFAGPGEKPSASDFEAAYRDLLDFIHAQYPGAPIVAVAGPMMRPPALAAIAAAAESARSGGLPVHVALVEDTLTRPDDFGCHSHPNVNGHRQITEQIAPVLARAAGWE